MPPEDSALLLVKSCIDKICTMWDEVRRSTYEDDLLCVLLSRNGDIELTIGPRGGYIEILKKEGKPVGVLFQPAWEREPKLPLFSAIWIIVPTQSGVGVLRVDRKQTEPEIRVLH